MSTPSDSPSSTASVAYEHVLVSVDDTVATITLNRPEVRNAQTPSMWARLAEIGANLPDEVSIVVIEGAGESFSAGLDVRLFEPHGLAGERSIPELLALSDHEVAAQIEQWQAAFTWLRSTRFISIAVVQQHAYGAGFQLALAADLRLGAANSRFCMKEAALGLVPDLSGTKPLVDLVGPSRALDICATARVIGASEAHELGILNAVSGSAPTALTELREATVGRYRAIDPETLRATKKLLAGVGDRSLAEQCRRERQAQVARFRALALR